MTGLEIALGRWVAFCEHRARSVLLVIALMALAAGSFAWRNAAIDSDLSKLIRPSASLQWYQHDQAYKAAFPHLLDTGLVVVSGRDFGDVALRAEALRDALRASTAFDEVFAPSVDPFLAQHRLYFLPPDDLDLWIQGVEYAYGPLLRLAEDADLVNAAFVYADLVEAQPRMPLPHPLASLADNFSNSLSDPAAGRSGTGIPDAITLEAWPHLEPGGDEDHYAILIVKGAQRLDQRQPNAELVVALQDIVATTPAIAGVRVRLSGEIKLADEEIGAALTGIGIAGTASVILLALILGIGVASLRLIVAIFALLAVGVVLTLGWATLAVGSFNTLALIFVVMFFGLGVDFAVHFALRLREGAGGAADSPAVVAAQDIGPALLLCGLTSSIAFLAFAPTAYRGLAELGIISAGGMFIAVALSLTLIPALLAIMGPPTPLPARPAPAPRSVSNVWLVLVGTGILALLALYVARDSYFDYSVLAMRDASTEGMSTLLELQEAEQATDYSINVLADAAAAPALAAQLEALDEVASVALPADLVPEDQAAARLRLDQLSDLMSSIGPVTPGTLSEFLPDATTYLAGVADKVPDDGRASHAAFAAALETMTPAELERLNGSLVRTLQLELDDLDELLAARPFTQEDLPEDLRRLLIADDGRQLLRVQPAMTLDSREATERFVSAVAAVAPNYSGRTVVEWGVGGVVVEAFAQATALAVGLILLVLLLYFREWRAPLLVLVPIALSLLFTAAIARVSGLTLNMANILVVPLIFGLGVDTGIHVVHRFRHDGGLAGMRASSTPRAVVISGLTTIGTFLSLSLSPHKGAASIGLLLFLAIGIMLLATFVVLPALLRLTERQR